MARWKITFVPQIIYLDAPTQTEAVIAFEQQYPAHKKTIARVEAVPDEAVIEPDRKFSIDFGKRDA